MERTRVHWWGAYEIPADRSGRWRVGPFTLRAKWCPPEWRISHGRRDEFQEEDSVEVACPVEEADSAEEGELLRIVPDQPTRVFHLTPRLADRPIVVRPETTFQLLSKAKITLYVSSPLWIAVELGEPRRKVLDMASWPLSDTWFGPSTAEGELCYAITTGARLHLENLPLTRHRAITRILLENKTGETVTLERLSLPVPSLSLYSDADGHLWTQTVDVELDEADKLAEVDIGKGSPEEAREARLVSGPRTPGERSILVRARNALLF